MAIKKPEKKIVKKAVAVVNKKPTKQKTETPVALSVTKDSVKTFKQEMQKYPL